jgi:hypothetical protein
VARIEKRVSELDGDEVTKSIVIADVDFEEDLYILECRIHRDAPSWCVLRRIGKGWSFEPTEEGPGLTAP